MQLLAMLTEIYVYIDTLYLYANVLHVQKWLTLAKLLSFITEKDGIYQLRNEWMIDYASMVIAGYQVHMEGRETPLNMQKGKRIIYIS